MDCQQIEAQLLQKLASEIDIILLSARLFPYRKEHREFVRGFSPQHMLVMKTIKFLKEKSRTNINVKRISNTIRVHSPSISRNIKKLQGDGLIECHQNGKETIVDLTKEGEKWLRKLKSVEEQRILDILHKVRAKLSNAEISVIIKLVDVIRESLDLV